MTKCERCGREQTPTDYCVKWKDNTCIRMESVSKNWKKGGSKMKHQIRHIRHSKRGKAFIAGRRTNLQFKRTIHGQHMGIPMDGFKVKTIKIKTYEYDDLPSENAKEKVVNRFQDMNVDYGDWYGDFPYEDLKEIGLTGENLYFDLDRGQYLYFNKIYVNDIGKFLKSVGIKLTSKAGKELMENMITIETRNYGGGSGRNYVSTSANVAEEIVDVMSEFLQNKLEKIRLKLSKEYDYQTSREQVEESIRANEYRFLEDGSMAPK